MKMGCCMIIAFLSAMSLPGCNEESLEINHYKAPCIGVDIQSCLVVRDDPAQEWTWDYSEIEGFQYEWGHSYRLRVRVEEVKDPPADGSSIRKTLIETLEDQQAPAGTPFSITLFDAGFFRALEKTGGRYRLLGERTIDCAPAVCQALDAALGGTRQVVLDLHHPDRSDAPLVLDRVH